jgi:hypothetical protein
MQGALLSARDERNAIQEIVKADTTGRSIINDYVKRTKDEKIVPNLKLIRYQTKLEVFAN